jgi:hypothetical protein
MKQQYTVPYLLNGPTKVGDPDSLNPDPDTDPDPAFQVNPDPHPTRIQCFTDQIFKKKKIQLKILLYIFLSSIAVYLFLGLHTGCPSYRRSLQLSKKNIQYFKK